MKLKRMAAMLLVIGTLAGCSTGSNGSSGGDGAEAADGGNIGLPDVVDWETARTQLYDSLAGKTVAYVPIRLQVDLTSLWGTHLRQAFEMLGAEFLVSDPAGDMDKMVQMVDSHINDQVDMIIIQNPDSGLLSEQVKRAHEAGIYIISLNVQGNQSSDAYVGADYVAMARDLALRMVDDCQAKGANKVAVVSGFGTDSNSTMSAQGWDPVFEENDIEVVSDQQSNYDPTRANEIAATVLQQHPDLCGFIVVWDVAALGVAAAVEAAGLTGTVGIYNQDSSQLWCDALRQGLVTAGTSYHASGIGVAAAFAAQELFLVGDPAGTRSTMGFVPYTIVDSDNVDDTNSACYGAS